MKKKNDKQGRGHDPCPESHFLNNHSTLLEVTSFKLPVSFVFDISGSTLVSS